MHGGISLGGRIPAYRASCYGGVSTQRKLALPQVFHASFVHHEDHAILFRAANLKSEAAALDANSSRGGPAAIAGLAAGCETASVFSSEDEACLFHIRDNDHAIRLVHQILGDAFIVCMHHVFEDVCCGIQPVSGVAFLLCLYSERAEGGYC